MVIKKHKNKNQYLYTDSRIWVRDLTRPAVSIDINKLIPKEEYDLMISNEMANARMNLAKVDTENFSTRNVIIVSDGFDFVNKLPLLEDLEDVSIIGVNHTLAKWDISRLMDFYVVNNPYKECMISAKYYPRCIVSSRTNPNFVAKYIQKKGVVYSYNATPQEGFAPSSGHSLYYVDDYRNPIAAAINLAYRWEAEKILLFCCDDAFKDNKSGAIRLENGLFMYPQQRISHDILDGICFWLKDIKIGDFSSGPNYKNIEKVNDIKSFFTDES